MLSRANEHPVWPSTNDEKDIQQRNKMAFINLGCKPSNIKKQFEKKSSKHQQDLLTYQTRVTTFQTQLPHSKSGHTHSATSNI